MATFKINLQAPTEAVLRDMKEAHAEGWHTPPMGEPREFCPDCQEEKTQYRRTMHDAFSSHGDL